jgi:hypothetical protein
MRRAPRRGGRGDPIRSASLPGGGGPRGQLQAGFPDRIKARLCYTSLNRVNPGVLTFVDTVFNLNSLFDPEFTGAGHQPRGFDTLATLYGKYRVNRCIATLHARQRAAHGIQIVMVPNNTSTALQNNDYPAEMQRSVASQITGSAQPVVNLERAYDCADVLGQTSAQYRADEDTSALVTANPAELLYLHVFAQQIDGATVLDYEFVLNMVFECEFFDRKFESPSSLARQMADLSHRILDADAADEEDDTVSVVSRRSAPPQVRAPSSLPPARRRG